MTSSRRSGILLLILAATGYAFFPIFTKFAFDAGAAPLDLITWRFLIATPFIWLLLSLSQRGRANAAAGDPGRGGGAQLAGIPIIPMLLLGALFGLVSLTAFYALQRLPASTYTLLLYTYPAVVALLLLLLGEPLSGRGWLALALTLVGVALTVPDLANAFSGGDGVGMLLALANGAQYAVYIVISSRVLRGRPALLTASALSITGSLLLMIVLAAFNGLHLPDSTALWLIALGIGLVSTVLTNICFYAGMQRVGAGQAAILSMLEPVIVLLLSFALLGESLLAVQLVGGALILASAVLLQLPSRRAASAR